MTNFKLIKPLQLLLMLVLTSTLQAIVPALSEYRMDECFWLGSAYDDVRDNSGNMVDATSSNAATISTTMPKVINHHAQFIGQNDQIIASSYLAGDVSDAFSVSFWVKADQANAFGTYVSVVIKTDTYVWRNGWGFAEPTGNASNKLRFFVNHWNNNQHVDTTIDPGDNWVHIVGVYDRTNIILYKNASLVDSVSYSDPVDNSFQPIKLGFEDTRSGDFIGSLDEVKFWDFALTPAEVQEVYTN